MNNALLVSAIAAVVVGFGHSLLGEWKVLRPLYRERTASAVIAIAGMRRLLRVIWHMPSFVWALTGVFTYGFVHHGTTPPTWFVIYAAMIYGAGALGNFWGVRKIHIGNVLLTVAAVALVIGARAQA